MQVKYTAPSGWLSRIDLTTLKDVQEQARKRKIITKTKKNLTRN